MEKIKALLQRPLYAGLSGLAVGLVIGWLLIGWWLWPIEWKDADASFLREDLKKQYLCMVVDSYKVNQNLELARARVDSLGTDLAESPALFDSLQSVGCAYSGSDPAVVSLKSALLSGVSTGELPADATQIPLPTQTTEKKTTKTSTVLLSLLCALFFLIGGALVYIFFIRNRKKGTSQVASSYGEGDYLEEEELSLNEQTQYTPPVAGKSSAVNVSPTEGPVAHFMTTYVIGDDLYDDSFSIDDPSGAFLGECGVGISDTIGVGDPKKVTAFEVWLFDKNDIQTVTKVLMSSHAMNDPLIRQRLASKGEPILVEPGHQILLETATLQLEARVIEQVYGQGALPSGSFFERLTLEIAVWPK
jgi:hypothetical protein